MQVGQVQLTRAKSGFHVQGQHNEEINYGQSFAGHSKLQPRGKIIRGAIT